jgi:GAF domain-containing protein
VAPDDQLHAELERLRETLGAARCTLRQPRPDEFFPVTVEVLADGAPTIADDRSVDLRTQPVPLRLAAGERQVVQEDCRAASDDPAFHAMLERYGGMRAQVVTAVRDADGGLAGILSVHDTAGPRAWTAADLARIDAAVRFIGERLA